MLECSKFILQTNNIKFNNELFNQIKGTAMSTIFTSNYATLSMGYFNFKLYKAYNLKFGQLLTYYVREN